MGVHTDRYRGAAALQSVLVAYGKTCAQWCVACGVWLACCGVANCSHLDRGGRGFHNCLKHGAGEKRKKWFQLDGEPFFSQAPKQLNTICTNSTTFFLVAAAPFLFHLLFR
jgi:hypothetical protein